MGSFFHNQLAYSWAAGVKNVIKTMVKQLVTIFAAARNTCHVLWWKGFGNNPGNNHGGMLGGVSRFYHDAIAGSNGTCQGIHAK